MSSQQEVSVQLEYELTLHDLRRGAWYLRTHQPEVRWFTRHIYLLVLVCCLLLADLAVKSKTKTPQMLETVVTLLVIGILVNCYWKGYTPHKLTGYDRHAGRHRLEVDTSGIKVETPHISYQCAWNGFCRFSQNPDFIFLFNIPERAMMIPKRACRPEELNQLLQILAEHLPSS